MDTDYADIIVRHRPAHGGDVFSRRHPPMAQGNRAKLFAPFAVLSGFGEAIRAGGVRYLPRRRPAAGEARRLNALGLAAARCRPATACVVYFVPRAGTGRDETGQYLTQTGIVRGVDPVTHTLRIGGRTIPLGDIIAVVDPTGQHFSHCVRAGPPGKA